MNRMPGVPGGGVVTEKGEFERAKSLRGIRLVGVRGTSNNHGPLSFRGRLPGPIFARARDAVHDGHEEVHDADVIRTSCQHVEALFPISSFIYSEACPF